MNLFELFLPGNEFALLPMTFRDEE
jgi:hypothetical protein